MGRFHIHAGGWLVQHKNIRFGGQCPGNEDALFLAAGELAEFFVCELGGGGGLQTFVNKIFVGSRGKPHGTCAAECAHQRHVKAGERIQRIKLDGLRHVAKVGRRLDFDLATDDGLQAKQGFKQRGFTGAVGAEDGGETAPGNGKGNARQNRLTIVANGQVFQGDDGIVHFALGRARSSAW